MIQPYEDGQCGRYAVLLFDVGGVLVELSGVETMLGWLGGKVATDELWRMWLQSKAVRDFETGRIEPDEFAVGRDNRVRPPRGTAAVLGIILWLADGLYPGTLEMLARIPSSYQRALLSNSNALHWTRVVSDLQTRACG